MKNKYKIRKPTHSIEDKRAEFSQIVKLYQRRLYWHIRKIVIQHADADDVLQNTFMKAWNGLEQFKGDAHILTWLYRIATNETLSFLAQKKRRMTISLDCEEFVNHLLSDTYFSGDRADALLQYAISTLPDKQRIVFNLRFYDDMSYQEISNILQTSVGGLKASYFHAKNKIETFLRTKQDEYNL